MRQLRCIATYSRQLVAPKTSDVMNHSTHQQDMANSRQSLVLTEFMSASISNYCLDSRQQDRLHCLTYFCTTYFLLLTVYLHAKFEAHTFKIRKVVCYILRLTSGLKDHADRLFGVTFNIQFSTSHV